MIVLITEKSGAKIVHIFDTELDALNGIFCGQPPAGMTLDNIQHMAGATLVRGVDEVEDHRRMRAGSMQAQVVQAMRDLIAMSSSQAVTADEIHSQLNDKFTLYQVANTCWSLNKGKIKSPEGQGRVPNRRYFLQD